MIEKLNGFKPYVKLQVPTVYDDTLTYYETVTQVIAYLNDVIDKSNDLIDETNEFHVESIEKAIQLRKEFEEFGDDVLNNLVPVEVVDTLNKWQQDGKLANLINDQVFGMKANKVDLDETNRQLTQTESNLNNQPNSYSEPVAILSMDDGWIEDYTVLKPYLETKNIVATIGLVENFIGGQNYMGWAEINELKELGWEFASHTKSHPNLTTVSYSQLVEELESSKSYFEENGLEIDGFIYPYNAYNTTVLREVRKRYKWAMAKHQFEWGNPEPIDQFATNRITLERPLSDNKEAIDRAVANNEVIILMGHGMYFNPDRHPDSSKFPGKWDDNIQKMKDNIQYIIDQGVRFDTMKNVIDSRGNSITIGDTTHSDSYYHLSRTGKLATNYSLGLSKHIDGNVTADTTLSKFDRNRVSIHTFMASDNAGFPTSAGTLLTYNFGYGFRAFLGELTFQVFHPHNSDDIYKRRWNTVTETWTSFKRQATITDGDRYVRNVQLNNIEVPAIPANGYVSINVPVDGLQGRSPMMINCHFNGLTSAVEVSARASTTGTLVLVFRNFSNTDRQPTTQSFTLSYSMP